MSDVNEFSRDSHITLCIMTIISSHFLFFIIFAPEVIRTTIGEVKGRIIEIVGRVIRNERQIYVKADSRV